MTLSTHIFQENVNKNEKDWVYTFCNNCMTHLYASYYWSKNFKEQLKSRLKIPSDLLISIVCYIK